MTESALRDDNWAGISRLHKIIALILALILALTWWLGRGADGRFGCLPGASTAAVSGAVIAPAVPAAVLAPPVAAVTPATAVPATPASAPTASAAVPAPQPAAATSAVPASGAPAASDAPPVPTTPAPAASAPAVEPKPATVTANASTTAASQPAALGKNLPLAKVHFALDKTKLWSGADKEMSTVLAYLKANPGAKAVLSGYHDPSGNREHNQELAKNRSHAVRDRLVQQGINLGRIIEEKPVETTGDGPPAEARRVEISIRP